MGDVTRKQGAHGSVRGARRPLLGPSGRWPSPTHRCLQLCPLSCPSRPLFPSRGPFHASRRVPALPGTCGRFSQGPLLSRRSERPWTEAGLGRRRGRPLVAAVALVALRLQHLDGAGGVGPEAPPRPGQRLPDGKGVGVVSHEQT